MFSDKYLLVVAFITSALRSSFRLFFFRRNPDGAIIATTKCGLVAGIWMHACIQVA